jgi:hypothetical protein
MSMPITNIGRDGKPVRVMKVPMSTGKSKFKSGATSADNAKSVFDRFARSNGSEKYKSL